MWATTPFSSNFYDPLKTARPWKAPHFLFLFFFPTLPKGWDGFPDGFGEIFAVKNAEIPRHTFYSDCVWRRLGWNVEASVMPIDYRPPELKFLYMPFFEVAISWNLGCDCKGRMWNYWVSAIGSIRNEAFLWPSSCMLGVGIVLLWSTSHCCGVWSRLWLAFGAGKSQPRYHIFILIIFHLWTFGCRSFLRYSYTMLPLIIFVASDFTKVPLQLAIFNSVIT